MRLRAKPKELESAIEDRFRKGVEALGCKTRKMNGLGNMSWPDRLVLGPCGFSVFVELKRPGEGPTKLQADLHKELRDMGHTVLVHDDSNEAIAAVRQALSKRRYD